MKNNSLFKLLVGTGLFATISIAQGADLWRVYEIARESDPVLASAEATYRAAQEAIPQSRAALLPQVNAGANQSYNDTDIDKSSLGSGSASDTYNANGYQLSLTQPLFRYQSWLQRKQADSRVAQAESQFGSVRQGLAVRVASAYFNVLAASDNLEFAQAEAKATEQQLRQVEQRFEVGLSAITDVHEARAGYDAAVAQEISARNLLAISREALRAITGVTFEQLAPLKEQFPLVSPDPQDIEAWVDTALNNNLELLAAAAAARVAEQEVGSRRAEYYPTVDLRAQHAYSDTSDSPLFGSRTTDNSVELSLSLPIYTGGLTSSRVREAHHLYNQAREQLEDQRRATIRQSREAYLNVVAGISQVNARQQAVSSAQTALEATQAGFEVGTRTAVDVLAAQRELFRAKRDYARSRYDYILSTLNLKLAAGTLATEDVKAVNSWLQE